VGSFQKLPDSRLRVGDILELQVEGVLHQTSPIVDFISQLNLKLTIVIFVETFVSTLLDLIGVSSIYVVFVIFC
jgi:hypothetical protein